MGRQLKPLVLMMACASMGTTAVFAEDLQAETQTLPTIVIVGSAAKDGGELLKQPLSTSIIGEQQLKDSGADKLDNALFYEAGILAQPYGKDNKSQWFKIRGFDASQTLDGTALAPNGFFVWEPEIYGLERLEIVKGASSFNYGASEPGGNVNLVSKRPKLVPQGEVTYSVGSLDKREIGADYSGVITDDVRYRLVGLFRQADGQQKGSEMDHYYVAPSFAWDITDRTHFTLLTSFLKKDGVPTSGFLPLYGTVLDTPYGKINPKTNLGELERDYSKLEQTSIGYEFSHEFENGLVASQNFRWGRLDLNQLSTFAWGSDNNRLAKRGYSYTNGTSDTYSVDNRLVKDFNFGPVSNKVMLGVDYQHNKIDGVNNGFGSVPQIDMFNPVHTPDFAVIGSPYNLKTEQLGFYLSNQANINDLVDVNIGVRHDQAESTVDNSKAYDVNHTSYNVGVMYHAPLGISPYLNYSTSFRPSTGKDGQGRFYKPYEGEQYEVGVKYAPDWMNGQITLAYFDLNEKNALVSDASNVQSQAGKRTNKGVELQADLKLTDNLSTQLAYTHNDSKQDLDGGKTIRTPLIPNDQIAAKFSYLFTDATFLNGLRLGAGVRYVGSTNDEQYYPDYKVKSYTLIDAMASYPLNKQLDVQVNATNLSDKKYVSACSFYCYYGAGRSVDLRVNYKW
ncbi:TonB-dependent siderophore receptor [Acinetobacter dispersus]|uniref:TonB-dependent siderophore receptor n=1 Tax=Acinetobacter dispersus TaxID=70348 RepID=UPI001F4AAC51|nr:TonB-dependent siderophore receptor [Acinetobacter dispersus]MCH7389506.1 TonB-dependent siderophore receptor [Acinetobacter dispersus]